MAKQDQYVFSDSVLEYPKVSFWFWEVTIRFSADAYGLGIPIWSQMALTNVSLISRCRGTAVQRPVAGFRKIVWFPPSRSR